MRSYDKSTKISKLVIDGDSLVMATTGGKIMIFDHNTFKAVGNPFSPHKRTISDLWVKHDNVILSCCPLEKKIYLKSWNEEFESQKVDIGYPDEVPLSLAVLQSKFMPDTLLLAIGTQSGKLLVYDSSASFYKVTKYFEKK